MRRSITTAALWIAAAAAAAEEVSYRVVDRRELDGSVLLVRKVARQRVGDKPFLAGSHWDLKPATELFRVRDAKIPARHVGPKGDPPAITFRQGEIAKNSWTNMLGGKPETWFERGEVVRLVNLNCAFKTVRMDLEAVCREIGRRLRGRVDFGLSGQVGGKTLEEANEAVAAVLEPIDFSRVYETCDPETGAPPVTVSQGTTYAEVKERLGHPRSSRAEGSGYVVDYDVVQFQVRDGVVAKIVIPAID